MTRRTPRSTLFPYTTLFRSRAKQGIVDYLDTTATDRSKSRINYNGLELSFTARDRKSTRLNSSHITISYAVFCLKKKKTKKYHSTTPVLTTLLTRHEKPIAL